MLNTDLQKDFDFVFQQSMDIYNNYIIPDGDEEDVFLDQNFEKTSNCINLQVKMAMIAEVITKIETNSNFKFKMHYNPLELDTYAEDMSNYKREYKSLTSDYLKKYLKVSEKWVSDSLFKQINIIAGQAYLYLSEQDPSKYKRYEPKDPRELNMYLDSSNSSSSEHEEHFVDSSSSEHEEHIVVSDVSDQEENFVDSSSGSEHEDHLDNNPDQNNQQGRCLLQ